MVDWSCRSETSVALFVTFLSGKVWKRLGSVMLADVAESEPSDAHYTKVARGLSESLGSRTS